MAKKNKIDNFIDAIQNTGYSSDLSSTNGINDNRLQFGNYFLTDAKQEDIIKALGGLGSFKGSDLASLLSLLGIKQNGDMTGAQMDDWNKQIMDSLLSILSEQDKRTYNEGIRNEQRLFDNPQNQLARLMGAGISRDAAIQMLSGGSGSGSGGLVTGDAASMSMGIPATQSDLNKAQERASIAQSVFGGISAVTGLVSLGISIPSAIAQVTAMGIQNTLSQKALVGLQSADSVMSAIENAVETGVLSTQDVDGFSNATDALNYINDHKDTNAFSGLFQNGSFAQVYGTKLGREMFANLWKNVRSSKDDGTILDNYIKSQKLQNALSGLQAEQIGAELQKLGAETESIYQNISESLTRIAEMNANIQVLNAQGKWINIQSEHLPDLWNAQEESLSVETDINRDLFEVNHAGVPILKQKYIDECEFAAFHAATLNSKELRDKYWASWLNEADNAVAASYLQLLYNNGVGDFATAAPHLWKLCMGLSYSGCFDGIRAGAESAAATGAAASGVASLIKATKYVPK